MYRFGVVLGYAIAFAVHHTEEALSAHIPLLGQRLPEPQGFRLIAHSVSGKPILPIPRHHGRGEQHECGQGCEEGAHPKMLIPNAVALNLHGIP